MPIAQRRHRTTRPHTTPTTDKLISITHPYIFERPSAAGGRLGGRSLQGNFGSTTVAEREPESPEQYITNFRAQLCGVQSTG